MKKVFRFLLLLILAFAVYADFATQVWSYPIAITSLCFLAFVGTLPSKKSSKSGGSSVIFGGDASGADGGC